MDVPSFWWRDRSLVAKLLAPFAAIYGAAAARRLALRGEDAGISVLCVGNLTLGGAGKTPTAMAVARLLMADGARPFFLTRGYGGQLAGPVRVDPARHGASDVGDEALLLARVAPVIVARDRVAGANMGREAGASVIVMDDGFQNPSLVKELSLLVVDARRGIGNGCVFPAGPLRAPLDAQLGRAQGLVVIGKGTGVAVLVDLARARGLAIFAGRLETDPAAIAALSGRKVLAFAGIGDPEKFFATLGAAGIDVPVRRSFADHHRYTPAEAAALIGEAGRQGLTLVTTEKDRARMAGDASLNVLFEQSQALPVTLAVDDEACFRDFVRKVLKRR
jgi:tetraacyldisaccharide 4'-kinase